VVLEFRGSAERVYQREAQYPLSEDELVTF